MDAIGLAGKALELEPGHEGVQVGKKHAECMLELAATEEASVVERNEARICACAPAPIMFCVIMIQTPRATLD